MRLDQNSRRLMLADVFATDGYDINVSIVEPGTLSAWHRHRHQDDLFLVLQGTVKFGIKDGEGNINYVVASALNPRVIPVPHGLWHGYENIGPDRAIIVMHLSQKYNPLDEERQDPEDWAIV